MKTYLLDSLRELDDILRGERTRPAALASGTIAVSARRLVLIGCLLGGLYGASMGLYSVVNPPVIAPGTAVDTAARTDLRPLIAPMLKVPLLFLLTLLVTSPSLYVFSAIVGSRLRLGATLRLLLLAITVNLCLLASLAPVTAFFTVCTTSYPFVKLLNVAFFAVSGLVGLSVLHRALRLVFTLPAWNPPAQAKPSPTPDGARDPGLPVLEPAPAVSATGVRKTPTVSDDNSGARRVFALWTITFGLVGAQMGWVLRPFIGAPDRPFEWFRARESNIFGAIIQAIRDLGMGA